MEYGLIGKTLGHSFSKPIHEALGGYPYELKELPDEAAVRAFFTARRFRAVNVTIPYKALALALCDEVSEEAKAIGAVNTVVNRGGRLFGYNTDFGGFRLLVRHRGVSLAGKTVLILGTGATQRTVRAVCTRACTRTTAPAWWIWPHPARFRRWRLCSTWCITPCAPAFCRWPRRAACRARAAF